MIEVAGILVEKDIFTKYFLCDIEKCLGGCCTFPGIFGAPLSDSEVPILEAHVEKVGHLLSNKSQRYIKDNGVAEYSSGRPTTMCINKRDCVFVYYEKNTNKISVDVALCAIENIFFEGKTDFRKPVSCWLFPIRAAFHKETLYLYYEKISECSSAVRNGKMKKIKIYQALKEPLIAYLGENWYNKLLKIAEELGE